MNKKTAIDLFGSITATARAVGVTPAAVSQWPNPLPDRLRDRVQAALWRAAASRQGFDLPARAATPLDRAAEIIGSKSAMSRALNITKAAISQWKDGRVPAEHCPAIERLTNGQVRCEELRPDIPWGVLRQAPQAEQSKG